MGTKIILKTNKGTNEPKIEGFIQTEGDGDIAFKDALGFLQESTKESIESLKKNELGQFTAQTKNFFLDIVDENDLT